MQLQGHSLQYTKSQVDLYFPSPMFYKLWTTVSGQFGPSPTTVIEMDLLVT